MKIKFGSACVLLFPFFFVGCAPLPSRTSAPEMIYTPADNKPSQILVEQTKYIDRVLTPEGMRESVDSSDFKYFIKEADGKLVELPFLAVKKAAYVDRIQKIFYNEEKKLWVGTNIRPATHMEHVHGLFDWRVADDEYINMRVKIFSREKLIENRDISICNPQLLKYPAIQYDTTKPAFRYCTKKGMTIWFPDTDISTVEGPANYPGVAGQRGPYREDKSFLIETKIETSIDTDR